MRSAAPLLAGMGLCVALIALFIYPGFVVLPKDRVAGILTDTPEILLAADLFNASQKKYLVEVSYADDIAASVAADAAKAPAGTGSARTRPTLVIGKSLWSRSMAQRLLPLNSLARRIQASERIYPSLLEAGASGGTQRTLPIAFDLILVVEARGAIGATEVEDTALIDIERIGKMAAEFDAAGIQGETMAFSPRWKDREFLLAWAEYLGTDFSESAGAAREGYRFSTRASLSWSEAGLARAVEAIRAYIRERNGSASAEEAFSFRYLKAPGYRNLEEGRILFSAMKASSYFLLPPLSRAGLKFSYFARDGVTMVVDLREAGILKGAGGRKAAEAFLAWLLGPEGQEELLAKAESLRMTETSFGIAGGFSSIEETNRTAFVSRYSELQGRLPPPSTLAVPARRPTGWTSLKDNFIISWLADSPSLAEGIDYSDRFAADLEAYLDKAQASR